VSTNKQKRGRFNSTVNTWRTGGLSDCRLYSSEKFLVSVKIFLANRVEVAGDSSLHNPACKLGIIVNRAVAKFDAHSRYLAELLVLLQLLDSFCDCHCPPPNLYTGDPCANMR
jgi:hypothetical protein